jgi:hypothetical protein
MRECQSESPGVGGLPTALAKIGLTVPAHDQAVENRDARVAILIGEHVSARAKAKKNDL